jgi:hypothetical protein
VQPCGICVDGHTRRRPSGMGAAAQQSGSIGATAIRWLTYRPRTTTSETASRSTIDSVEDDHRLVRSVVGEDQQRVVVEGRLGIDDRWQRVDLGPHRARRVLACS